MRRRPLVTLRPAPRASVLLRRPRRALPYPLDRPAGPALAPGHATATALREAGLAPGAEVLVPSMCAGMLAGAGLVPRFYTGLEPDESDLGERTRALVIAHPLGFPADSARWRRWSDAHGLLLVEDCSEAWLAWRDGLPVGALADVAVFRPATTLPIRDIVFATACGRLLWERRAAAMRPALRRLAQPSVARRRREHYRALLTALEPYPPFADLPDGASPLVFPLAVARPGEAVARLAAAGVEARPLASSPEHAVALPVHHELRPADLDRIVEAARARNQGRPELRLEPVERLDSLRDEWCEIGLQTGNVFATWEWQSTWWRHYGRGRTLAAAACREAGGKLVAILPLYLAGTRPGRLVRFLGHGAGDRLGPICVAADRLRVARAFRAGLRARRWGSAIVLAEQVPAEESWSALLGARVLAREGSPVVRIPGGDWDEFLATRSANFRQQIRGKERKLARRHRLHYRLIEDPEQLPAALDVLFALHRARWGGEDVTGYARAEAFHRDFAAQALARRWLRLWLMELDGQPVAAWHGFRFAGADWYYQMGRDPAWDQQSVGFVLLSHTLRDCVESGLGEYRLLRGGEAYKGRFATGDPGLETIAVGSGQLARAALDVAAPSLVDTARRIRHGRRTKLLVACA